MCFRYVATHLNNLFLTNNAQHIMPVAHSFFICGATNHCAQSKARTADALFCKRVESCSNCDYKSMFLCVL